MRTYNLNINCAILYVTDIKTVYSIKAHMLNKVDVKLIGGYTCRIKS